MCARKSKTRDLMVNSSTFGKLKKPKVDQDLTDLARQHAVNNLAAHKTLLSEIEDDSNYLPHYFGI